MAVCRLLPALVVAVLLLLVPAAAHAATEATSSATAEQRLVQLINDRRADAGVPAVTARADLHDIARDWSFVQAERAGLGHNPSLSGQACCWTEIAENVARSSGHGGSSADTVARALLNLWANSSGHDQTMTDPEVDQVGLGVVVDDDGTAWGTAVFRRCDGSSCAGSAQGPAGDTTVSWAPPPAPPEPEPAPEQQAAPAEGPSPSPSPTPTPSPAWTPSPPPVLMEVPMTSGEDGSDLAPVLMTKTSAPPRMARAGATALVVLAAGGTIASALATRGRP